MCDERRDEIRRFEISLDGVRTRKEFYRALKEAGLMEREDGSNADALYDRLTGLARPVEIFLLDCEEADETMGEYMDRLRELCADAEDENPLIAVYFW